MPSIECGWRTFLKGLPVVAGDMVLGAGPTFRPPLQGLRPRCGDPAMDINFLSFFHMGGKYSFRTQIFRLRILFGLENYNSCQKQSRDSFLSVMVKTSLLPHECYTLLLW